VFGERCVLRRRLDDQVVSGSPRIALAERAPVGSAEFERQPSRPLIWKSSIGGWSR